VTSGTLILTPPAEAGVAMPADGPFRCPAPSVGIRPVLVDDLGIVAETPPAADPGPRPVAEMILARCSSIRLRPGRPRG